MFFIWYKCSLFKIVFFKVFFSDSKIVVFMCMVDVFENNSNVYVNNYYEYDDNIVDEICCGF